MEIVLTLYMSPKNYISKHQNWETLYGAVIEYSEFIDDRFNVYELVLVHNKFYKNNLKEKHYLKSFNQDRFISLHVEE